ncbi:hypothetical protein BXZ70DRAFT_499494 [Cristinia sonorae]|uniref:Uncharacterized protein n=1 Tax=Cristinia sonorae TaxID=1940300 RepID=A0A8K0UG84_9AGAR|nr:hypothetical protein BXZ70DRAFT_499494 [Cristinia sonorae]
MEEEDLWRRCGTGTFGEDTNSRHRPHRHRQLLAVRVELPLHCRAVSGEEARAVASAANRLSRAWLALNVRSLRRPSLSLVLVSTGTLRMSCNVSSFMLHNIPLEPIRPRRPNHLHSDFFRDNSDPHVIAVVDHHTDEGLYKDTADPRIVTVPTGSASSLVVPLLEQNCPDWVPPELPLSDLNFHLQGHSRCTNSLLCSCHVSLPPCHETSPCSSLARQALSPTWRPFCAVSPQPSPSPSKGLWSRSFATPISVSSPA